MEEKIKTLLLSWEEYNQKECTVPYIFSIIKDSQELIYIGTIHIYNPKDEQFNLIEKYWNQMIVTQSLDRILVVRESITVENHTERDQTILKNAESGFITYLAKKSNIDVKFFEPNYGKGMDIMSQQYTREELFYHDIAMVIVQWNSLTQRPPFKKYIQYYIEMDARETGWSNFDFSLDNIKKIHINLFNIEFDETDEKFFRKIIDPSQETTIINRIGRDVDMYRDTAIIEGIVSEWQKGKSIFVVYGSGHAIRQERALKTLLK